jgi:hypothetical protein
LEARGVVVKRPVGRMTVGFVSMVVVVIGR